MFARYLCCLCLFFSMGGFANQHLMDRIPKTIWQTYKTKKLPRPAHQAQQTWKKFNPGYSYFLFDDADIEQYISEKWDTDTLAFYKELHVGAMKADLWRYLILATEGGVYSDIDSICLIPVKHWLPDRKTRHQNVLVISLNSNNSRFCQWTIAATPNHPAMQHVCRFIVERWKREGMKESNTEDFVFETTGPVIWTRALLDYLHEPLNTPPLKLYHRYQTDRSFRKYVHQKGIFITPKRFFSGTATKNLVGSCRFGNGYNRWREEIKKHK